MEVAVLSPPVAPRVCTQLYKYMSAANQFKFAIIIIIIIIIIVINGATATNAARALYQSQYESRLGSIF